MNVRPTPLLLALLLAASLPAQASVQKPTALRALQVTPASVPARPANVPGQVQPVAPGTLAAPRIPQLTLDPSMPEVQKVEYLSNGHIEVAGAVVTLEQPEQSRARAVAGAVARRVLAARAQLDEVDVSVYDKGTYGGFGGPSPLLTASVPRDRLNDFLAWTAGQGTYERAWVSTTPATPPLREPDRVRELTVNFLGSVADKAADAVHHTTAKVLGGVQGGLLYHGSSRESLAALTFDDAPHPMYEPLVLDTLRRAGVHATFFVIGRNARAYPYFIRDMAEQGHEIGNHTFHHVRLPPLTPTDVKQELTLTDQTLQGITGKPVRYFRPPGGDYTPATLRAAEGLGLTTVFWTDDPGDFQNPGVNVLLERYTRTLRRGGVVLLHDNAPEMLQVLPMFLRIADARNITLDTVGVLVKPGAQNDHRPAPTRARPAPALGPVDVTYTTQP